MSQTDNNSVLLGEEKGIQAAFIKHMLQQNGWNVTHVSHGEQILEEIKSNSFAFIVIGNLRMPDSVTTIKTVRAIEQEQNTHTPIIAMSPYSVTASLKQLMLAGADKSVSQPIYKPELDRILGEVVNY